MTADGWEDDRIAKFLDDLEHAAVERGPWPDEATDRERAMLDYALALTIAPGAMTAAHLRPLREAGLTDAELLDANQVVAYFAYANRVVDGLGVALEDPPTAGEALDSPPK
ncbi:MAG: peroxidase [Deltaproteobacteria bacterium]|nr:peroxidase [Deltaproteobacteria bacterium]